MRLTTVVPLVALIVAVILSLAVVGLRYERGRLLDDFAADQEETAGELGSDLRRELSELDDDARLVESLLEAARRGSNSAREDEIRLQSGFQALATVVRHHRSVTLFRAGGVVVKAIDPMEGPPATAAFLQWSRSAAEAARNLSQPVVEGPREGPDARQFFIYARTTAAGEVLVLVSEARYLLEPVLRSRSPFVRYLLVDTERSVWLGCSRPQQCRAFTGSEWASIPALASLMALLQQPKGRVWTSDEIPAVVGLRGQRAAVAWQTVEHGGRSWLLAVIASAQSIEARQRALLWWLLATGSGLALALTTLGGFIIRHQRRAVSLTERLAHAQELAELRERTEKLVENVSAGLIAVTSDGRIALTNRFLSERVAPLPAGALLAEALSEGDGEAARRIDRTLAEAVRSGRPGTIPDREVPLLANKPGHYDVRIIPLDRPAADLAALLLIEDLSELKSLEKQLVRAEKLITVGVLTAGLAHEIGTPLGIIRGRAEVLMAKVKDPAVARDLESMIRQIDQIGSTIRQVLDFARAQPVEFRSVSLEDAVVSALAMLDWRLRAKSISVRIDTEPHLPPLAADADQLQQVLINLLLNACDACPSPGSIVVRLHAVDAGRRVVLEIIDDGCGIAPADLNAVFDPFFTTKKRGEGTGLGLPVAASIVSNHNGEITIQSRPGKGTTVTVTWPAAETKDGRGAHGAATSVGH